MNKPNADAIRRLVTDAAEKYGSLRPEVEPLTPQEQEERLKSDTLLLMVTPAQAEYLRAIHDLAKSNGYPPSVRQIGIKAGRSSTASVHHALEALKSKGLVTWMLGARRTLTITEAGRRYLETHPKEVA